MAAPLRPGAAVMSDTASALGVFLTGMATAVHPCPLTTNLAVVGLLAGWRPGLAGALRLGLPFVLGYAGAYALLALMLALTIGAHDGLARALQEGLGALVGPLLVLGGMLQLDLLPWSGHGGAKPTLAERLRRRDWGPLGALALGGVLALALCPATAALLFGGLLQVLSAPGGAGYALLFGLGAALPLLGVVLLIGAGISLGGPDGALRRWLPRLTGTALILVGLFLTIRWAW
jgi:cytochrome c-type biogenesis protein